MPRGSRWCQSSESLNEGWPFSLANLLPPGQSSPPLRLRPSPSCWSPLRCMAFRVARKAPMPIIESGLCVAPMGCTGIGRLEPEQGSEIRQNLETCQAEKFGAELQGSTILVLACIVDRLGVVHHGDKDVLQYPLTCRPLARPAARDQRSPCS